MYAVVVQLIIFSTIGCAFPGNNVREDIIWFPIEGYENGYVSSQGEYFLPKPSDPWFDDNFDNNVGLPQSRRRFRSVPAVTQDNNFGSNMNGKEFVVRPYHFLDNSDIRRTVSADEPLIFPGETDADQMPAYDCKANCPLTPEYNPVCGTDLRNYHNLRTLECEQLCGKRVRFAHFGICGRSLPGLFKPTPRRPRSTTRTMDNLASDDRTDRLIKLLRI